MGEGHGLGKKGASKRYRDIFQNHYPEKHKEQCDHLREIADYFLYPEEWAKNQDLKERIKTRFKHGFNLPSYIPENCGIELHVSPIHIQRLSEAYFIDIIRYKEYHYNPKQDGIAYEKYAEEIHSGDDRQRFDRDKIAAFLTKWILKCRPIQAECTEDANIRDNDLRHRVWHVNSEYALIVALNILGINIENIKPNFRHRLIHHFTYRTYDEASFSLLFQSLRDRFS